MTTNSPADIPTLTPIEIDAAIASIEPGAPPPLQLAAQLQLPPHELLEILARPHVAAFAEAARAFVTARADILARYTHITALQNLAEIAQNKEADIQSRLHAAIAILRDARGAGGTPAHTIAAPARHSHTTSSPAPRFRLPPPGMRAMPPPQPPSAATPAPPPPPAQEPKPHQCTTGDPAPALQAPSIAGNPRQSRRRSPLPLPLPRPVAEGWGEGDHSNRPLQSSLHKRFQGAEHPRALGAASPPAAARPP